LALFSSPIGGGKEERREKEKNSSFELGIPQLIEV
jgi:hypothetical protein